MTDLIDELARDPSFLALCPMTETDRRKRTGEELVTRFFAYGDGLNGYRDQVRTRPSLETSVTPTASTKRSIWR